VHGYRKLAQPYFDSRDKNGPDEQYFSIDREGKRPYTKPAAAGQQKRSSKAAARGKAKQGATGFKTDTQKIKREQAGKGLTPQTSGKRAEKKKRKREAIECDDAAFSELQQQRSELQRELDSLQDEEAVLLIDVEELRSRLDEQRAMQQSLLDSVGGLQIQVSTGIQSRQIT
jgi:chromosome segregation ATPase